MSQIGSISEKFGSIASSSLRNMEASTNKTNETTAFGSRIESALDNVSNSQKTSNEMAKAYEMGIENDLSKVMINQQISSLGFQFTLNARNKVLSAYKDIMNMPV